MFVDESDDIASILRAIESFDFVKDKDEFREKIFLFLEKYKKNYQIINGIKILPIIAIAELKLVALFRRKKIRDLFDIYVLLNERIINILR